MNKHADAIENVLSDHRRKRAASGHSHGRVPCCYCSSGHGFCSDYWFQILALSLVFLGISSNSLCINCHIFENIYKQHSKALLWDEMDEFIYT